MLSKEVIDASSYLDSKSFESRISFQKLPSFFKTFLSPEHQAQVATLVYQQRKLF